MVPTHHLNKTKFICFKENVYNFTFLHDLRTNKPLWLPLVSLNWLLDHLIQIERHVLKMIKFKSDIWNSTQPTDWWKLRLIVPKDRFTTLNVTIFIIFSILLIVFLTFIMVSCLFKVSDGVHYFPESSQCLWCYDF